MQDLGSTGFVVEVAIHGDVTIGIWLGGHKRDRDVPALAYQFHTAMLDADQVEPYSTVGLYHTSQKTGALFSTGLTNTDVLLTQHHQTC